MWLGTMSKYCRELLRRKDLLVYLVTSGLKAQHRNSVLGYFWWLLDPLLGVAIYYFVVVKIFRHGGGDYGLFLIIGLIVWRWVTSTVTTACGSIIGQAGVITQVYMPKLLFPLSATLTQLVHFAFGLVIIVLCLIFFHVLPGMTVLWLPYIILMQLLFLTALAAMVAYLCVFIRDIGNLISHVLTLWFFGSPIIWSVEMMPERIRWLIAWNPMAHFVASYRGVFMYHHSPDYLTLLGIGFLSVVLVTGTVYYYSRFEHEIIKVL